MTSEATIDLDLDPDFWAVLRRAVQLWGGAVPKVGPWEIPCARARAYNRLYVRRMAAGKPRPGQQWSSADASHLIDDELARMGCSAEESKGCGCYACWACNPPVCKACGGIQGGACAVPA